MYFYNLKKVFVKESHTYKLLLSRPNNPRVKPENNPEQITRKTIIVYLSQSAIIV